MEYRLGEYIADRVTNFSEGDFSKVGNKFKKAAIIGSVGLAALAPATAMSIEDQIKADTRAYTTASRLYATDINRYDYPSSLDSEISRKTGNEAKQLLERAKAFRDNTVGSRAWNEGSGTGRGSLKSWYTDLNPVTEYKKITDHQLDFEKNLDYLNKRSALAGKVYKEDKQKNSEKSLKNSFSEGDFGIKNLKGNLAKVLAAGTIGLTAFGGGALGHWTANHPMFASDHQRPSISAMKKAADSYENQARNYQLLALSPDSDNKSAQDNLDKSTHYFERANALHEEADKATRNATKIPRALGAAFGSLSGALSSAAAIGAVKRKKEEDELVQQILKKKKNKTDNH